MTNEQIVEQIRNGYSVTDNMQLLYERNLPLIKHMVKPYAAYEQLEDLLQEAYFGLYEAVQRYESSENVLFMTYAGYWIRRSAQLYVENYSTVVRLPNDVRQKIVRYNRTVSQLVQKYGRIPTDIEIAGALNTTVDAIQKLQYYAQPISSLDVPLEDGETTFGDTIQADFSLENDVVDKIYAEHSKNELWGIVERHTGTRESQIIKEIFINNKTMSQVAREYDLSLDRIRQIKEKGLRKLRIGKAKRELSEKLDVVESCLYRAGVTNFNEHNYTSTVEYVAMRRAEIDAWYKRKLEECRLNFELSEKLR